MLEHDSADRSVLHLGGTGTISASCVRLSVETGMRAAVPNRGTDRKHRQPPDAVEQITGDVTDEASLVGALEGRSFDAIVDFLADDETQADRAVCLLGPYTKQYVVISSACVYGNPVMQTPITESTPTQAVRARVRAAAHLPPRGAPDAGLARGAPGGDRSGP